MTQKKRFDYYYGTEAEQFNFYRLPKVLFTNAHFKVLSSDAKILYGMMLDRMSLSVKNQWIDKEKRVYIIFTLENVMEIFSCSERKAGYLLKELDSKSGIGLIEKKRQGLGKPNLIYVKNFISANMSPDDGTNVDDRKIEKVENVQMQNGKGVQFQSGNASTIQSSKDLYVKSSKEVTLQSGKELPTNNTYNNKTEYSKSIYPPSEEPMIKQTEAMDKIEQYRNLIKKNIEYDLLKGKLAVGECDYLDDILDLLVETIGIPCETIRIEGKEHPYQLVKAKMLKINSIHVEYVIQCLHKTTKKIRNIKSYLLTMLYNAPTTLNSFYRTEVNYDLHNDFAV